MDINIKYNFTTPMKMGLVQTWNGYFLWWLCQNIFISQWQLVEHLAVNDGGGNSADDIVNEEMIYGVKNRQNRGIW